MMRTNKDDPSHADIEAHCVRIIDAHAHRSAIDESDLRLWVREVVAAHGEQAVWHARRAGGFGGSEIGVLVRNHAGVRADFQASAHDIVQGKLLRRMPLEDSSHLKRGRDNEPQHAQWFYAKYGCQRDQDGFDRLAASTGVRAWMRYSPDELALMPVDRPNPALGGARLARWLVDYKAPSVVHEGDQVKFQYACQLHQGAMICASHGIHLDGLMLSQFDWANWQLKDDHVGYDPQLAALILRAGDHYWDYVLRGQVPDHVVKPRFGGEADLRMHWQDRANQIARLKAMKKAVEELLEPEEEALRAHLDAVRMAGVRCTVGDLSISAVSVVDIDAVRRAIPDSASDAQAQQVLASLAKSGASTSFDTNAMQAHLRAQGVPMKQFLKVRLDEAKVYDWALHSKIDPDSLISEQVRFSSSKELEQQARDTVREVFGASEQSRVSIEGSGELNDREGQESVGRSSPRSVMT